MSDRFIRTSIKDWPELRHALAHMSLAIEELADGNNQSSIEHLRSVEGLFLFGRHEELELSKKEREMIRAKCTKKSGSNKGGKDTKGGMKGTKGK